MELTDQQQIMGGSGMLSVRQVSDALAAKLGMKLRDLLMMNPQIGSMVVATVKLEVDVKEAGPDAVAPTAAIDLANAQVEEAETQEAAGENNLGAFETQEGGQPSPIDHGALDREEALSGVEAIPPLDVDFAEEARPVNAGVPSPPGGAAGDSQGGGADSQEARRSRFQEQQAAIGPTGTNVAGAATRPGEPDMLVSFGHSQPEYKGERGVAAPIATEAPMPQFSLGAGSAPLGVNPSNSSSSDEYGVVMRMGQMPRRDELVRQVASVKPEGGHFLLVGNGDEPTTAVSVGAVQPGSQIFQISPGISEAYQNHHQVQFFAGSPDDLIGRFAQGYIANRGSGIGCVYVSVEGKATIERVLTELHNSGALLPQAIVICSKIWGYDGYEWGQLEGLRRFSQATGRGFRYVAKGRDGLAAVRV